MPGTVAIRLPRAIIEKLRREAERQGLGLDEYIIEILGGELDPEDRAEAYLEAARALLEEARGELEREGGLRQAAEKLWGATALAIKAYAAWRDGRRLASHGELWGYKSRVAADLGEWVYDSWNAGQAMHTCFYEGWCGREDVEKALERVERLVRAVEERLGKRGGRG